MMAATGKGAEFLARSSFVRKVERVVPNALIDPARV
jgi:hypothetical protein